MKLEARKWENDSSAILNLIRMNMLLTHGGHLRKVILSLGPKTMEGRQMQLMEKSFKFHELRTSKLFRL